MNRLFNKKYLGSGYMKYLSFFAIAVIPAYTYLFATKESPYYYTMSMIGNTLGYRKGFIVWGVVTGFLLTFYIARIYVLKSFKNARAKRLLLWSHVFLILTVAIPAVETLPVLKKIHALMAVAFALSLSASLYLFIRFLGAIDESLSLRSSWMLFLVIAISLALFFVLGNTGIFELFFFFSLSLFLLLLKIWLKPYQDKL